jgi:aspartyl protease
VSWQPLSRKDYPCSFPAPIISDVCVQDLRGFHVCPGWSGVIDCGSDRTIIPTRAAAYLDINIAAPNVPQNTVTLTGSAAETCPVVYVQISHHDFGMLEPVKVAFMDRDTILLGRDCLAQFVFTFHGPKKHFVIHQDRNSMTLFGLVLLPHFIRRRIRPPENQH